MPSARACDKVTPKPTSDLKEIKQAILKIQESQDFSGEEYVFSSFGSILDEYGKQARATDRKLVVMLLTDEIGNDIELLEEVVDRASSTRHRSTYSDGRRPSAIRRPS